MLRPGFKALILSVGLISHTVPSALAETDLDAQLQAILEALPGIYAGESPIAAPPKGDLVTLYHAFTPITAPQFGETLIYYELRRGSADAPASQRKIFSFNLDPNREVNSMKAFVLGPDQPSGNMAQAPDILASLEPESLMTFPSRCKLTWSANGGAYKAEVRPDTCYYTSAAFKKTIRPAMTYLVDGDRFEWEETLNTGDMQVMFSTGGVLPAIRQ